MQKFQQNVQNRQGDVIAGASVAVTVTSTNTPAALFSDNGVTSLTQPLTTDANGGFFFFAANGTYDVTVTGTTFAPIKWTAQILFDPDDADIPSSAALAGPSGAELVGGTWFGGAVAKVSALASSIGASLIGFVQAGAGAVYRSVQEKLRDTISVDDYPTFQAAYDAAGEGSTIIVPDVLASPGSVSGTKKVTWQVLGNTELNIALLNLPGIVLSQHGSARMTWQGNTAVGDYATTRVDRTANHVGGSSGSVASAMKVKTAVSSSVSNFEWAFLAQLDNQGAGENVALYGQGNRKGTATGITWAGCFEARDYTEQANPSVGLIGVEVGVMANGGDTNKQRIALDVVLDKGVGTGSACEAHAGVRIGNAHNNNASGKFKNGLLVQNVNDTAVNILSTSLIGIDLSGAVLSTAAIRLASGQRINFSDSLTRTMRYEPTSNALRYATGSVVLFEIADDATLKASGALYINNSQVVADRQAGYLPMTGTSNKSTAYDVSTVTLPQLASRIKAIQDSLTIHGLIGA